MKNLHLPHLEDLMLIEGVQGANTIMRFLQDINKSSKDINTSIKWDGAPAIIAGINPENGKFFVGTKSVLNKTKPLINYCNKDIETNHGHDLNLVYKLEQALRHLPKIWTGGIFQGDLLYHDVSIITLMGIYFTPNTITYKVEPQHPAYDDIINSKLGIAFHTQYTGDKISELQASLKNKNFFKPHPDVWLAPTSVNIPQVQFFFKDSFTGEENFFPEDADFIIPYHKELLIYINSLVRDNRKVTLNTDVSIYQFLNWLCFRKSKKLKTWNAEKTQLLRDYFFKNYRNWKELMEFYDMIVRLKESMIHSLNGKNSNILNTYINTNTGLVKTDHEGFVLSYEDGTAVKLVNREEFSRRNFEKWNRDADV